MKRCTKCGIDKREEDFWFVANGEPARYAQCKVCQGKANKVWCAANRTRLNAKSRKRNLEQPGRSTEYVREWRKRNQDKVRANYARDTEKHRERDRARYKESQARRASVDRRTREWAKKNPLGGNIRVAKRRATRKSATPPWANSEFEVFAIAEAYHLSRLRGKLTGFKWHVDHQVPLQSKLVCGLHCSANLQVIPGSSNIRKSNRYWPDMP